MTLDRHTVQTRAISRGFWLSACLSLAFAASACVGPDLEPPGGSPASTPARSAGEPPSAGTHATETSAAAGKGGPTNGGDNPNAGTVMPPPKLAGGGSGGSSASGSATDNKDQDAGVSDASVDASSSP